MRSQLLPVCTSTKSQLTAMLLPNEHPMRFPFVIDVQLTTDIHDHLLDRAGERPRILARIVRRDWLATIASHVQPLACNRELARLGPDLALADLFVVDVDGQGAVGDVRWVLYLLGEDSGEGRGSGWHRLAGTDLLFE